MKVALPALPSQDILRQLCLETVAREFVQPDQVEKDFYLTRLLWVLGTWFEERLLLKGGTLLSKVDLGFFRMSEDADFVMPGEPSRNRGLNVRRLNEVRDALKAMGPAIGVTIPLPGGHISDRGAHIVWELHYPSAFGPQSIRLEVSLRPTLRPSRRVKLGQLMQDPLLGDYDSAYCWALNSDEARAEKVRAACTREAIRDFYDLERLMDAGADLTSPEFIKLVDVKLRELGAPPLRDQSPALGITPERRAVLLKRLKQELPQVLKTNAPPFSLDEMLSSFDELLHGRSSG